MRAELGDDVIGGVAAATMYPSEGSQEIRVQPNGEPDAIEQCNRIQQKSPALESRRGKQERKG